MIDLPSVVERCRQARTPRSRGYSRLAGGATQQALCHRWRNDSSRIGALGPAHADFIRTPRRRLGVLAGVAALALAPSAALAAPAKPKPKPIAPYVTHELSEVQIS
jgi:hypothetical protein